MRTQRRNAVLAVLALLTLAFTACTDSSDDPLWDDEDLGSTSSELVIPAGMVAFAPTENTADFLNPERGYYSGYKLENAGDATSVRNGGFTLAISIVNLDAYTWSALPAAFLTKLNDGFAQARRAGIKLIVRFTYDDTGGGDATQARMLGHITQLTPVLRDNADVIAVVQAGMIGAWGEWHSSTNGMDNSTSRGEVIKALLAALPSSRSVQLRKPTFKNAYRAGALTTTEAFTGSSRSRLGHHNDCFLASASDLGTYDSPIDTWKTYLATDTQYAPMGGEACVVYTARTNCTTALAELRRFHWSYLNRMYNASVINQWISEGCESTIRRELGYRFVATRVAHTPRVAPGGVLGLELDLNNKGFSIPMNQRPIDVVLTSGSTRKVARLTFDARRVPAGATTTIRANLRVPANLPVGTYTMSLRLPDASSKLTADPRYAIQLANSGMWDATTGDNVLTRNLVIDAAAGGATDLSATTFVQL